MNSCRLIAPCAVICSMLMLVPDVVNANPIRILPLGDSITQGGNGTREEFTYRLPLFRMLTDAGVDFDFIGSMNTGLSVDFKWPDYKGKPFDLNHEGHYGWKTAQVRDHLKEWMPKWAAAPDIVLIHLGTNDQKTEYDKTIAAPLKDIITMLREKNPKVVILVGHLNFNEGEGPKIREVVEGVAKEMNTEESPVITVHHYKGWCEMPGKPESDTFDWAHPNPQGQEKMAKKWFESMQPYIKSNSAPATK